MTYYYVYYLYNKIYLNIYEYNFLFLLELFLLMDFSLYYFLAIVSYCSKCNIATVEMFTYIHFLVLLKFYFTFKYYKKKMYLCIFRSF